MDEPWDPRIDRSRAAVYLAEDHVAAAMDSPIRAVVIDGELHSMPPPLRFGTLEAMQRYADAVLGHPRTREIFGVAAPVRVISARGFRKATYRAGVITIPAADRRGQWALRDTVLLHEVAHHLADEHGHGPAFRAALVHLYRVHVDQGAAVLLSQGFAHIEGMPHPDARPERSGADDKLRRVAALLAKAESTTHPDEAEAYLARATIVAQRHSIDLAVAALSTARAPETPTRRMISIGEPRRPLNARFASLLVSIARAWRVRSDIGPSSTYVIVYGMPGDLDQVESVYATASTMMVSHAAAHVRAGRWRGTSYWSSTGERKPVTATVARNAFCLGFTERLGQRLDEAQTTARRQAADGSPASDGERSDTSGSPLRRPAGHADTGVADTGKADTGGADTSDADIGDGRATPRAPLTGQEIDLALRRREAAVQDYHRRTSRAKGTWRGASGGSWSASGSRAAGRRAAEAYGAPSLGGGRRALPPGAG